VTEISAPGVMSTEVIAELLSVISGQFIITVVFIIGYLDGFYNPP